MKSIERAYRWLLLSPIILPVVIWGGLIYPYLVPKTLLFYALSFISVGAFLILAASGREFYYSRLSAKESWIPFILLVLAYVASIFGIDFYRSFWSLFVRGDGLLMLTCAVADFYLVFLYADRNFFKLFLRAITIVGSFVAVYGIGEWFLEGGRVGSLLGNAAFFAGYLGITFFATLASAKSFSPSFRRVIYLGAILQLIAIILTATRGTILALIVAALVALAYIAVCGEGRRRMWASTSLLVLVVFGGLFFPFRSELAQIPFAPVARFATIGTNDPDVESRLFIWKNMVGQIKQHPFLGVGAEHIDAVFNTFYDPTQIQEEWFDRSHNAFLDYAVQYGIGGFILYVGLICSFFIAARRLKRHGEYSEAALFALLAVTYATQNFFIFDTISSFWLLLALLASVLAVSLVDAPRKALPSSPSGKISSWIVAIILLVLIIPCSIMPTIAAYDLAHAYAYAVVDPTKSENYLANGFALGTYGNLEYGYEAEDMYMTQSADLTGEARVQAYSAAYDILKANFGRFTYDARTALLFAQILTLAPPEVTVNPQELTDAITRAIAQSPKRTQPWYILVNLAIANANTYPVGSSDRTQGYAAAEDLLQRYSALVPKLAEPYFILAQLQYASGDKTAAAASAAQGKENYQPDLQTATRAVEYYETALDLPDATYFLQQVLNLDPTNAAAKQDLTQLELNGY